MLKRPHAWHRVFCGLVIGHERSRVVKFCGRLTRLAWFNFTEIDPVGVAAAFLCVYREFIKFWYDRQETNKFVENVARFKY
jgi:hypothetical protein